MLRLRTSQTPLEQHAPQTRLLVSLRSTRVLGFTALRLVAFFLRITFERVQSAIPEAPDLFEGPNQFVDSLAA